MTFLLRIYRRIKLIEIKFDLLSIEPEPKSFPIDPLESRNPLK